MTELEFNQLVELVEETGLHIPSALFVHGINDWHTRIALARFLCHPAYQQYAAAKDLLHSVIDIASDEPSELEEKIWSLQKLAFILRKTAASQTDIKDALSYINKAISLAENTTEVLRTVVRGELWLERWILLSCQGHTDQALLEADEQIDKHRFNLAASNSYLYNAYRFKAQAKALTGNIQATLVLMKRALSHIKLTADEKRKLAIPFSAKHKNLPLILSMIDKATPAVNTIAWTI